MFSWNVSQPAWHSLCIFVAVAYMIRFQTSRRTRHTLYLNPGEATKNERNVNHEHRQYYNILLFSTMRQPVGGVTVYLHAAPSEQYNLLFRRLSILWLYCGYKKKKKNISSVSNRNMFLSSPTTWFSDNSQMTIPYVKNVTTTAKWMHLMMSDIQRTMGNLIMTFDSLIQLCNSHFWRYIVISGHRY